MLCSQIRVHECEFNTIIFMVCHSPIKWRGGTSQDDKKSLSLNKTEQQWQIPAKGWLLKSTNSFLQLPTSIGGVRGVERERTDVQNWPGIREHGPGRAGLEGKGSKVKLTNTNLVKERRSIWEMLRPLSESQRLRLQGISMPLLTLSLNNKWKGKQKTSHPSNAPPPPQWVRMGTN